MMYQVRCTSLTILLLVVPTIFARATNTRIIGGYDTSIEEHPHQVSLQDFDEHFCGGSIVKAEFILTAAHCMIGRKEMAFQVRVGSSRRLQGGILHRPKTYNICPGFSSSVFYCDAAVVRLQKPIRFSLSALPINLISEERERPRHGDMLITTGWGMTAFYDRELPDVLQAVRIPTIDVSLCSRVYAKSGPLKVMNNMFCAGGGLDKGSFKGDSGGPIINAKGQQVGIVSWGRPAGDTSGYPGVYTDITGAYVRKFIVEHTQ